MRRMLLFVSVFAALLLMGCTSEDWERIERAVIGKAINDTINDLNPLKPPCKEELSCDNGLLSETTCLNGTASSSYKNVPYSCSGTLVLSSLCNGNQLSQTTGGSVMYCDSYGKLEIASCPGGKLYTEGYNDYKDCSADGAGIDWMSCKNGAVAFTREDCPDGKSCSGTSGSVKCS